MNDPIYAQIEDNVLALFKESIKDEDYSPEDYALEFKVLKEIAGEEVEITIYNREAYFEGICLPEGSYEIVEPEEDIQEVYKRDNPNCLFI